MLFIDYISEFNTIVHSKLITKLTRLGLHTSFCNWILDFMMGCPHMMRAVNNTSDPQHGGPTGYACLVPSYSNTIKFSDNTTW